MRPRHILLVLLPLFLLAACASKPPQPQRLSLNGFSLLQPVEEEKKWVIARQTPNQVILGRPGDFTGETFSLQASVVKLPAFGSDDELLRYVRTSQRAELDPKRFRIMKHDVVVHPVGDQACALSLLDAEDRAPTNSTGPTMSAVLETLILTCPHPQDRSRGINLSYSHRCYPEDRDHGFAEKGTRILDTLEFGAFVE